MDPSILGYQRFLQLDCEIRNTLASINNPVFQDSVGWAGVNTFATGSTIIFRKRIIIFQFKICNQRCNEKERSLFFCKKVACFSPSTDVRFPVPSFFPALERNLQSLCHELPQFARGSNEEAFLIWPGSLRDNHFHMHISKFLVHRLSVASEGK